MTSVTPADASLFVGEDMKTVRVLPFGVGEVAVFSMRCPARAARNEDAAALLPFGDDGGVLVVADGAGGVQGGGDASRRTVEILHETLARARSDGRRAREAILDGIEAANRDVLALGIGAATTVAVVEVHSDRVRPYHAGDSQVLQVGANGRVKFITSSHSPVGYAERSGLIEESEALLHLDRHFVSNVIGQEEMTIEVGAEVEFAPGDTLVVACDGLFDNLTRVEITRILREVELEKGATELVTRCVQRMLSGSSERPSKPDDLTVLVYRLDR